jgi:Site-specific recombinases, DNA invertase Pin homologs
MKLLDVKKLIESGRNFYDIPLRVVYYARVSTEKDEQINSLRNQTQYYEDYIRSNSNWTYIGGYIDEGISGTSTKKRDSFLRMISDAKNDKFDYIVTKEISRFSRNTLDSIRYTRELLSHGVGVFFQNDNINTLSNDAELRLTIMSSIAQDEVRKLSERVRFGFKRAQENGVVLGQNNIYGYTKTKGKLTINDNEAEVIRKIFEMYTEGKSGLRRIAIELENNGILAPSGKMFSYGTLYNIVRNPKYKGYYAGKKYASVDYRENHKIKLKSDEWIVYKDSRIPAIVSEELWNKANTLLDERGKSFKNRDDAYQSRYAYSGKIFCIEHDTAYHRHVYKNKNGDRECWNCRIYRLKGKINGCDSPTIYSTELDEILSKIYNNISIDRDNIITELTELYGNADNTARLNNSISILNSEIDTLNKKKDKLLELSIGDFINNDEFKSRNDELNKLLADFHAEIDKLKNVSNTSYNLDGLKSILYDKLNDNNFTCSEISDVLLDKIYIDNKDTTNINMYVKLKAGDFYSISLADKGISQAQVSRLEKGALDRIKKHL